MDPTTRNAQVQAIAQEYADRYKATLRDWLIYHQREIVFTQCTYLGTRALKNPTDAWIYQEILHRVRPSFVIEIGSASGGSTMYLAHLLKQLGKGMVLSIDKDRTDFNASADNIIEITGDSSSPNTVAQVFTYCEGSRCLVIHDGDHSYESVLRDLKLYSPLVTPGSYLIVEDGIVDLFSPEEMSFSGPGPLHAIVEFLDSHAEFEADRAMERYLLTYNPFGFLRRLGPTS